MYFHEGYNTKKFIHHIADLKKFTLNVATRYNTALLENYLGSQTL